MSLRGHVVVTGGAGFIGAHVCRELHQRGFDVVALDDLSTGARSNLRDVPVTLVEASILEPSALDDTLRGAAAVVHLAARPSVPKSLQDPVATHTVNATGTIRVLEAARAAKLYTIVASSSSVYGPNHELPQRETASANPVSPYAVSKLAAESYALSYQRCFGLPVLAFRFFNVFGPLQPAGHAYAAVVPSFVSAALTGVPVQIHGDGQQTRDFTYVGTVAHVIAEAVEREVTYDGAVNLAFGSRTTLLELIAQIEHVLGRRVERAHVSPRPGDVRDSQADNQRLRSLFPQLRATEIGTGLKETVAWFLADSSVATSSGTR